MKNKLHLRYSASRLSARRFPVGLIGSVAIPFVREHSLPTNIYTYTAPGIPTFSTFADERAHILIHTAAVFRDFSRKGFTEGMSGHISVRDPEHPTYIWMNPLGKHFGLMTAGDLICLDIHTGKVVGGNKVMSLFPSTQMNTMLNGQ